MKDVFRLFVILMSVVIGDRASGVVLVPLEIEQLAKEAQLVAHGKVLSKTCLRNDSGRIITRIELQVSEIWKGEFSGQVLTFVHGGGTLGERRSVVSGQAEYDVGEEIVGFFVFNRGGEAVTVGLAQGKFHTWKDTKTGEKLAANPFHGGRSGFGSQPRVANIESSGRLTLIDLKQRVQGAAR